MDPLKCPRCLGEVRSLHSSWRGYDITPNPLCPKCANDMVLEHEKTFAKGNVI
jgi:hypothetical protein